MRVLVTGGAGYIGSVVTEQLIAHGHDVCVIDSLKHGVREAVHEAASFVHGDIQDAPLLTDVMGRHRIEAVAHLAAEAFIDDSLRDPGLFYRVNLGGGLSVLDAMRAAGVRDVVFSSTAAVYGQPESVPIPEDAPLSPCNAYGDSKLAFERLLAWYRAAHGFRYVALRYFNASGATARCGEARTRETHLIPLALSAALGQRDGLDVFGDDYDTPDGTCVRDYVHVADIARAHLLALDRLGRIGAGTYNLGNGAGYSNREVIAAVKDVTGRAFAVRAAARRPGDPARLVADATRASRDLGWTPSCADLRAIIQSAWTWRLAHPRGYTS